MRNKLAVLIALANRAEGRATLDQLDDDVARLIAESADDIRNPEQFAALDHVDLFESGLVVREGDCLQMTENGSSILRALGIASQDAPAADLAPTSRSLRMIDDLIGPDARLQIIDLEPRLINQSADPITPRNETTDSQGPADSSPPAASPRSPAGNNDDRSWDEDGSVTMSNQASTAHGDAEIASDAPDLSIHKFGSGVHDASPPSDLLSRLTARVQQGMNVWRRHVQENRAPQATRSSGMNVERGLLAVLSLLVVMSCAGALGALMQVKSLKSELAALQRELPPLKERIASLDQIERSKEQTEQKVTDQIPRPIREARAEPAPLVLSREEIQLIRDYIKPAPSSGPATEPMKVGDPVAGPTIPFPSPITERVPKLIGARFSIRNGTIIISGHSSARVDAVIGSN